METKLSKRRKTRNWTYPLRRLLSGYGQSSIFESPQTFLRKWFEENSCYPNCAAINIFSFKNSWIYGHNHFNGYRIINSFHSTLASSFRQVSIMSCVRQNVIYLLDISRQALVGLCREAITGKLLSRRGRNRRGKQALGGSVEHNRFFDGVGVGQRPKNQQSALERGW